MSGSEVIEGGPPEGLPVAGRKIKPGLNRIKAIFHEEIKVAKRERVKASFYNLTIFKFRDKVVTPLIKKVHQNFTRLHNGN